MTNEVFYHTYSETLKEYNGTTTTMPSDNNYTLVRPPSFDFLEESAFWENNEWVVRAID